MRIISAIALSAVALWWLVTPVSASGATGYDPYAPGNTWEYEYTAISVVSIGEGEKSVSRPVTTRGTVTNEIVSEQERRPNGDVTYLTRSTDRGKDDMPDAEEQVLVAESVDLVTARGSYTMSTKMPEKYGGASHEYSPPLFNFPADIKPGSKWRIGTIWEDKLRYTQEAACVGRETVETPAGTFEDCLKVVIMHGKVSGTMPAPSGEDVPMKSGKGVDTLWLAKGIGMVKEVDISQMTFDDPRMDGAPIAMTTRQTTLLMPGYEVGRGGK